MSESSDHTFADLLLKGAREAAAHAGGAAVPGATVTRRRLTARDVELRAPDRPSAAEIRRLRDDLGLSQAVFADLLNVSLPTVQAWEQGKRAPDGPSLRLLEVARHQPEALLVMATGSVPAGSGPEDNP